MGLFAIACPTCTARLMVRDPSVIGQILECPKCGSMVQVVPPEGWQPPSDVPLHRPTKTSSPKPAAKTVHTTGGEPDALAPAELAKTSRSATPRAAARETAAMAHASASSESAAPHRGEKAFEASTAAVSTPGQQKSLLMAVGVGVIVLLAGVAMWLSLPSDKKPDESPSDPVPVMQAQERNGSIEPSPEPPKDSAFPSPSRQRQLDNRWIPRDTRCLLSLRLQVLMRDRAVAELLSRIDPLWQEGIAPLTQGLGITVSEVRRITWAMANLNGGLGGSVVIVELDNPLTDGRLKSLLSDVASVDCKIGGAACYRQIQGPWQQPFAIVDPRTLVTGPKDRLAGLPADHSKTNAPGLFILADEMREVTFAVGMEVIRSSRGKFRDPWPGDWTAARDAWQKLSELTETAVVNVDVTSGWKADLVMDCGRAAEKAQESFRALSQAILQGFSARREEFARRLQHNDLNGRDVRQAELLLTQTSAALSSCECQLRGRMLFAKMGVRGDAGQLTASVLPAWKQVLSVPPPVAPKADPLAKTTPAKMPDPPQADPGPAIDVSARLAVKLGGVDYRDAPLARFVQEMSQLAGLSITLDVDALTDAGLSPDTRISVQLGKTTVGDALRAALAEHGLQLAVERDHGLITTPRGERAILRQVDYDLLDLVNGDASALPGLADLIRQFVEPAAWKERGGTGQVEIAGNKLRVRQSGSVHAELVEFCEKLCVARGLPARQLKNVTLDSRYARAKENLEVPVTANFQPTPLAKLTAWLTQRTGVTVLIDNVALRKVGLSAEHKAALQATKEPLVDVLVKLTDSLEISFRIIDAKTVQITSRLEAAAVAEFEFYPLAELLTAGANAEELIRYIHTRIAPTTWAASDPKSPGRLHFDKSSRCLIVLQSQTVQLQVEDYLSTERAKRTAKAEAPGK